MREKGFWDRQTEIKLKGKTEFENQSDALEFIRQAENRGFLDYGTKKENGMWRVVDLKTKK